VYCTWTPDTGGCIDEDETSLLRISDKHHISIPNMSFLSAVSSRRALIPLKKAFAVQPQSLSLVLSRSASSSAKSSEQTDNLLPVREFFILHPLLSINTIISIYLFHFFAITVCANILYRLHGLKFWIVPPKFSFSLNCGEDSSFALRPH